MKNIRATVVLTGILCLSCVTHQTTSLQSFEDSDTREKVIAFVCNNADSLGLYSLQKPQVGDSIFVEYFDRLSDDELKPKIIGNYLNNTFYYSMLRDTIDCDGRGSKHQYDTTSLNKWKYKLTTVSGYRSFLQKAKVNDVYLVICRPLQVNTFRYYLISIESKGTSNLERIWVEVNSSGCITEVGSEFGVK